MLPGLVIAITSIGARGAAADGLELDAIGARAVARAGVGVVSEDGAAALWINPGAMARRSTRRLQLGVSLNDADRSITATDSPASPTITDRGTLRAAPTLGFQTRVGRLVLGVATVEHADLERVFPRPQLDLPAGDVSRLFPHRYTGTGLRYSRRAVAAGAALRATRWLGLGAAVGFAQTLLRERRRIWAGFGSRDMPIGIPTRDLIMELEARDDFVPEATAGALIAPPQLPMEMAISAGYRANPQLSGPAVLAPATTMQFPEPLSANGRAHIDQGSTIELRAGLRYLGDRVLVEADARLVLRRHHDRDWRLDDVRVRDDTGVIADLTRAESLVDRRDHARIGSAADIEVVRGFLWLTAGYAFRSAASRRERVTAVHGDTAAHTIAVGAEGHWNHNTVTVGYSRTWSRALVMGDSAIRLVNPFEAGTIVVGNGRYDQAHDAFGVSLELAWK
jgi:hypothetical protein